MQNYLKGLLNPRLDAIGLEIGTSAIKIVELRPSSPPALLKAVSVPTPVGSMQDGVVIDPQLVADAIKAMLTEHKIRSRYVVTTIANQSAITRNISVPKMERKDLDEAIRWEAEHYIPYPIDDVVLDYDLLDNPADLAEEDAQMELVIAAAPQEVITKQIEVIKLAGLEPVVIDVKPFAALRALYSQITTKRGALSATSTGGGTSATSINERRTFMGDDGDVVVLLEIGASSTAITLVRGERILMTRNINISADDFTTALQKAFGISFDQAEDVKIQYASATVPSEDEENANMLDFDANREKYAPEKVYDVIRPTVNELVTEIRRSLEFYRVQSGDIAVDRMYLSGGGAKLRGLANAISDSLGFRIEVANPWGEVSTDASKMEAAELEQMGPEFVVPLGLALRGVSGLD